MKKPVCHGHRQRLRQNFNQPRPFADPDVAARKLMEMALSSFSGYRAAGHSAEMAASRLMKKDEITKRIAELTAPAVRKTRITVESLLAELEATVAAAREAKQFGAVNGSLALIGKLTGLLREQVEIGGPGEFARCETAEAIMRKLAPLGQTLIITSGSDGCSATADRSRRCGR